VASLAAAAVVVWLLVGGDDEQNSASGGARAAGVEELRALERELGRPVYWAGRREGATYELTETSGATYVRYLPDGVEVGSERDDLLTVATYPQQNALARVRAARRRPNAVKLSLPDGGVAVADPSAPNSVYFTYPGAGYQVEVFDSSPQAALGLVVSGRVRPVSGRSAAASTGPRAVSVEELRSLAGASVPVYWAGAREGTTYELTQTASGGVYIRYLPSEDEVGAGEPDFLAVGAYPDREAFENLQAQGRREGYSTESLGGGGIAVYARRDTRNVYVAYPGDDHQVEVFDPAPTAALEMVKSGAIRPIE
jgi:hypothetical protein